MAAAFRLEFAVETVAQQSVVMGRGFQNHIAAMTAIATGRTAARDIFLPAKGQAAIAAVSADYLNFGFVNKHN